MQKSPSRPDDGTLGAYLDERVQAALAAAQQTGRSGDFVQGADLAYRAGRGIFKEWGQDGVPADLPADLINAQRAVLADGQARHLTVPLPLSTGLCPVEISLAPVRDDQGRITGLAGHGICRDKEQVLEQAARDHARLFAKANHDLRQPFQAMRLFMHLLETRITDPKQAELLARLGDAVEAGAQQLGALLDLSGLKAGTTRISIGTVPVGSLLDRMVEELGPEAEAAGVTLLRVGSSASVRSDAMMLDRLLRQLIGNAIRHAGRGGRVLLGARRRGDGLAIQVLDSGAGIAPEDQNRIFEEFTQLDDAGQGRRGLGLGLAIVRRGAEVLGHKVGLVSAAGQGSRFELVAPLAEIPVPRLSPATAKGPADPAIAVVEDDRLQLAALEAMLEDWGCVPHCGGNGGELEAALTASGRPPDLLITDFHLPQGDSGLALAGRIRARYGAAIPALLLTGDLHPDVQRAAKAADMALLAKPVSPARLRRALEQLLGRPLPRS